MNARDHDECVCVCTYECAYENTQKECASYTPSGVYYVEMLSKCLARIVTHSNHHLVYNIHSFMVLKLIRMTLV